MTVYLSFADALLIAVGGLVGVWLAGSTLDVGLSHPWGMSVAGRRFSILTLGNTAVAVVTALLTTQGKTILLVVLPVLILLKGVRVDARHRFPPSRMVQATLALICLLAISYLRLVHPWSGSEFSISNDDAAYGRFVRHMIGTGSESYHVDALPGEAPQPEPYHYGDLWHAAFFARVFSANAVVACILLSTSLLWLNIAACASAIVGELSATRKDPGLLLGAVALLGSGLSWVPSLDLPGIRGDWWNIAPLLLTKVGIVVVWFGAAFLMWLQERPVACAGSLMVASLLYLVVAPAVALTVPILLMLRWRRGLIAGARLRDLLVCALMVAGWLIFLYPGGAKGGASAALGDYRLSLDTVLRGLRVLATVVFKSGLSYAPLWAFWVWSRASARTSRFRGLSFFIVLGISSAAAYAVLHPGLDSVQHWSVPYVALGPSVWAAFWAQCSGDRLARWAKQAAMGGLLLFLLVQNWPGPRGAPIDVVDLEKTKAVIGDISPAASVGFIRDPSEWGDIFDRSFIWNAPERLLLLLDDRYNPVCLSVENIPEDAWPSYRRLEMEAKAGAALSRFVSRLKNEGRYEDYPRAQAAFVRAFRMKWILLSPRAVMPAALSVLTAEQPEHVGTDGWRWYRVARRSNEPIPPESAAVAR